MSTVEIVRQLEAGTMTYHAERYTYPINESVCEDVAVMIEGQQVARFTFQYSDGRFSPTRTREMVIAAMSRTWK